MNELKPGWKTSEAWVTLAMMLIGLLVASGVISPGDRASVEAFAVQGIMAIVALCGSAIAAWQYIHSRTEAKRVARESQHRERSY